MPRTKDSPSVLLEPHHRRALRSILERHPGTSLRKLCPLVAEACALPHMNIATLSRFIERHRLPRVLPKGMAIRALRRDPQWPQMLEEHGQTLQKLFAEMGSWSAVGRRIGDDLQAQEDAA